MKKLLYSIAIVLGFISCGKDMENHGITIYRPTAATTFFYADAAKDSVVFTTFDSYESSSSQDWLVLDPTRRGASLPNTYYDIYVVAVPFTVQPNTTGTSRTTLVTVHNFGKDWDQNVSVEYVQFGWHNILRPIPEYASQNSRLPETATFVLQDTATQLRDSIIFSVNDAWTLTASDFVTPEVTSGNGGMDTVRLTLTPNTTGEERTTTMYLQSGGVTTPVQVKQAAKKQ